MSLELFVRGLHKRTAVARYPCFSWTFLFLHGDLICIYIHCLNI